MAEALKTNTSLTELNIAYTGIGNKGAKALAYMLKNNSTLTELNISYNNINDEGTQALAEALKTNTTLTKLDLSKNNVTVLSSDLIKQINIKLNENYTKKQQMSFYENE